MASNYYAYPYGNTNYAQNQAFPTDQYSSTAAGGVNATQAPSSQSYYRQNEPPNAHPNPLSGRQPAAEHTRPLSVQYSNNNSSDFSAPTHQVKGTAAGSRRQDASSARDSAAGYTSNGLYQSGKGSTVAHSRQSGSGTNALPERAEAALGIAAGWQTSSNSSYNSAPEYTGYSYQKPDNNMSQQQYYGSQKSSSSHQASTHSASLSQAGYGSSTHQAPAPAKPVSQRKPAVSYQAPAQEIGSSYSRNYETALRQEPPANSYQQPTEYGKSSYQEDSSHSAPYLQNAYTLPQPTPTRATSESSNSLLPNTYPTSSTTYSTDYQTSYEKPTQSLGRPSSATKTSSTLTYGNEATAPSGQYYPGYDTAAPAQHQPAAHSNVSTYDNKAASSTTTVTPNVPAPKSTAKPKKPRQPAAQKSPGNKTPKPKAPRKPKAAAAAVSQAPTAMPPQHTYLPAGDPNQMTDKSGIDQVSHAREASPEFQVVSMEQHMREMVEKMREYQARDPTVFQQVWENVKKSGPGATGGKPSAMPMTTSKSASGVGSPSQRTTALAKPSAQPARASTTVAGSEGGRNTPGPGSAASQAQRTVWPASQKVTLSKTVSKFFNQLGQPRSESFIMGLLNSGPTFSELCQKLEAQGYKFERNKLALELLKTSETFDPSNSKSSLSTVSPAISAAKPSTEAPPKPIHLNDLPPRNLTPQSIRDFNPRNIKDSIPNFLQPDPIEQAQNFVAPSLVYREVYPPIHAPTPYNEPEPVAPQPITPTDSYLIQEAPQAKPPVSRKRVSLAKKVPISASTGQSTPEAPTPNIQKDTAIPPFRDAQMVDAQPLALPSTRIDTIPPPSIPETFYVQSTAAEDDSLLRSLQSRLDAQVSKLKELASPLKPVIKPTVMTPSQSSAPPPPPPISTKKAYYPHAPAFEKKNALRRNAYDPKTIVHAVLLATGRHPHYEGLNSQLTILKRLHPDVFDNSTDLAAIPWDIYDPPAAPLPGEEQRGRRPSRFDEEETRGRTREPVPLPTNAQRIDSEPPNSPLSITEGPVRGKRGRPRGRPSLGRGVTRGRGRGAISSTAGDGHTNTHSVDDTSTSANAHKYGTGQSVRVNIHTLRGNFSGDNGSGRKRKHGNSPPSRTPGENGKKDDWAYMVPVFKCQWENCNHQLQNLETLRRHMLKKHKVENEQGVLPCRWADCGSAVLVETQDEHGRTVIQQRQKRLNFGTGAAWDRHVLDGHLRNVKEELGKGMSVSTARSLSRASSSHSVEGRIRSMSRDRNGRSVTPVITGPPFGYKFEPPPGFSAGTQFRIAHEREVGEYADEKKMYEDELARVARIGAGMEGYSIPVIPGLDYDNRKGYSVKVRKLVGDDPTVLPPLAPVKKEDEGSSKGKERAID